MIAHDLLKESVPLLPSNCKLVLVLTCGGARETLYLVGDETKEKSQHYSPYHTLPAAQTIFCSQPSRKGQEETADRKTAQKLHSCVETTLLVVKPKNGLFFPTLTLAEAYLHHTQGSSSSSRTRYHRRRRKREEEEDHPTSFRCQAPGKEVQRETNRKRKRAQETQISQDCSLQVTIIHNHGF